MNHSPTFSAVFLSTCVVSWNFAIAAFCCVELNGAIVAKAVKVRSSVYPLSAMLTEKVVFKSGRSSLAERLIDAGGAMKLETEVCKGVTPDALEVE